MTSKIKELNKQLDTKIAELAKIAYFNLLLPNPLYKTNLMFSSYSLQLYVFEENSVDDTEMPYNQIAFLYYHGLDKLVSNSTEANFNEALTSIALMLETIEKYYKLNLEHAKNS